MQLRDDADRLSRPSAGEEDPLARAILETLEAAARRLPPDERAQLLVGMADGAVGLLAGPGGDPGPEIADPAMARVLATLRVAAELDDGRGSGQRVIGAVLARIDELLAETRLPA